MNPFSTLDQPNQAGSRTRKRRPLPPQETRDWMAPIETAFALGTTARRSDRSLLRRVTLAEYLQAWNVLDERERLGDLVTFCGLRESEAYGLKNGDLFQQGAIRIQRWWYRGDINPTKSHEISDVGIGAEIFERLIAWTAALPERRDEGWVFPSERIVNRWRGAQVTKKMEREMGLEPTTSSLGGNLTH